MTRVAFVIDRHGWAFDSDAHAIAASIGPDYTIDVLCSADYTPRAALFYELFFVRRYDIIHFWWSVDAQEALSETTLRYLQARGVSLNAWIERFSRQIVSASIYTNRYLTPDNQIRFAAVFSAVNAYAVGNQILYAQYEAIPWAPLPAILGEGVDLALFAGPEPTPRQPSEPLVVGWAGNSQFNPGEDHKGIHTIIRPAVAQLQAEGVPIVLKTADQQDRLIPHEEMPAFYRQLHVYICASAYEGAPLPVLESMASGLAVVSTRVGLVPEAFGPRQQDFILPQRSAQALADALRTLATDDATRLALAQENLQSVQAWSWPEKSRLWRDFLDALIKDNSESLRRRKAYTLMAHYNRLIHWDGRAALRYVKTAWDIFAVKARRRSQKFFK
ncbi:MAG: glycosyltransferase [Vampirovibrionales bacterium]|nr:glycosyltransferase [Vampirovibrionales bacterium]